MTKVSVRRVLSFGRAVAIAALIGIVMESSPRAQQRPQCAERQIVTVNARILNVWKGKNAVHFAVNVQPLPGCRVVNIIVDSPPPTCTNGRQIRATGELAESEGPIDGFEVWRTREVSCQ